MAKCIIIGGGFAGLSAAVNLSNNNISVHLIEASPKLGGRAYSFIDPVQNDIVDNGQHILMGCYRYTLEFLRMIGSLDKLDFQKSLKIKFVNDKGEIFKLHAPSRFYPVNLLMALLNYNAISFKERINLLNFFTRLARIKSDKLRNLTIREWLRGANQNDKIIKSFWEIIAVSTLNSTLEKASAETFSLVLKEIFLKGNKASAIVLPNVDLSKLYCEESKKYILRKGGRISLSEKVLEINSADDRISEIITNKSRYCDFDYIISAVPHFSLIKFLPSKITDLKDVDFQYSPILNIHVWLKSNPFQERFYSLIDSDFHWVFNHEKYITLVTSCADRLIVKSGPELLDLVCKELSKYFPMFKENFIQDYRVIKERRATFIPSEETEKVRRELKTPFTNFVLAGDWINTGLPSTIESAVKSGKIAALQVIDLLKVY
ncbi:MAG: hypothetical protein A2V66_09000 [Ignavibacteria bacterium RBG_13_36_8]|nr:MAG: hypothetical protein A2V66_09000 [Ignavibacteria bacterium RBG_13_36_8]